ncbi:hypothetical protein TNCV_987951 [Trichonephila clavipes]|nr:hypothetical protein TNCV_987951 [Trichonephila clavipes]
METFRLGIPSRAVNRKGNVDGLMGQRFHSDEGVKVSVLNWLHGQPTSFFADRIRNLSKKTYLNAMVDFFNRLYE